MRPLCSAIGMKRPGEIEPQLGMAPPQQRLERDRRLRAQVEGRLIFEIDLVGAERVAQRLSEAQSLVEPRADLAREELMHSAAALLGLIERDIGVLEQLLEVRAVVGIDGDADAHARRSASHR